MTQHPKPRRRRPAHLAVILLSAALVLSLLGSGVSMGIALHAVEQSRSAAAGSRHAAERLAADEATTNRSQAQLNRKSCLRGNAIVDSVFSLADTRAPSRKSAELILKTPAATDVQRESARTTIKNLDALNDLFHTKFRIEKCPPSPPAKENP